MQKLGSQLETTSMTFSRPPYNEITLDTICPFKCFWGLQFSKKSLIISISSMIKPIFFCSGQQSIAMMQQRQTLDEEEKPPVGQNFGTASPLLVQPTTSGFITLHSIYGIGQDVMFTIKTLPQDCCQAIPGCSNLKL